MKTTYFTFLIILLSLTSCTPNSYRLEGQGADKVVLIEYIGAKVEQGDIGFRPLVVIDGKPYRHDVEFKNKPLPITANEIKKIETIGQDIATKVFGEAGKDGAVLITSKNVKKTIE